MRKQHRRLGPDSALTIEDESRASARADAIAAGRADHQAIAPEAEAAAEVGQGLDRHGGVQRLALGPDPAEAVENLYGPGQLEEVVVLEITDHQRVAFDGEALAEAPGELGDLVPIGSVELEDPGGRDASRARDEPVAVERHGEADLTGGARGGEPGALDPSRRCAVENVDSAAAHRGADAVGADRRAVAVEGGRPAELLVQAAVRGEELLRLDKCAAGLALEDVDRAGVAEDRPGGGGRSDQDGVVFGGDREAELVDRGGVRGIPLLPVALGGGGSGERGETERQQDEAVSGAHGRSGWIDRLVGLGENDPVLVRIRGRSAARDRWRTTAGRGGIPRVDVTSTGA